MNGKRDSLHYAEVVKMDRHAISKAKRERLVTMGCGYYGKFLTRNDPSLAGSSPALGSM